VSSHDGLPRLSDVARAYGLTPSRALGQNFLFDLNLTARIARAAGPLDGVCVIEVGPGPGGLTRALLSEGAAKVIAIERDSRCLPALADIAAHWPGRLAMRWRRRSLSLSRARRGARCASAPTCLTTSPPPCSSGGLRPSHGRRPISV
jgi:predicted RNA methylase